MYNGGRRFRRGVCFVKEHSENGLTIDSSRVAENRRVRPVLSRRYEYRITNYEFLLVYFIESSEALGLGGGVVCASRRTRTALGYTQRIPADNFMGARLGASNLRPYVHTRYRSQIDILVARRVRVGRRRVAAGSGPRDARRAGPLGARPARGESPVSPLRFCLSGPGQHIGLWLDLTAFRLGHPKETT